MRYSETRSRLPKLRRPNHRAWRRAGRYHLLLCALRRAGGSRRSYRSRALRPTSVSDLFRRPIREPFVVWVRCRRLSCISWRMLAIVGVCGRHLVVGRVDRLLFRVDPFGGGSNFSRHSQFLGLHRQESTPTLKVPNPEALLGSESMSPTSVARENMLKEFIEQMASRNAAFSATSTPASKCYSADHASHRRT